MSGDSKPTRSSARGRRDKDGNKTDAAAAAATKKETEAKAKEINRKPTTAAEKKKAAAEEKKAVAETAPSKTTRATRSGDNDKKKATAAAASKKAEDEAAVTKAKETSKDTTTPTTTTDKETTEEVPVKKEKEAPVAAASKKAKETKPVPVEDNTTEEEKEESADAKNTEDKSTTTTTPAVKTEDVEEDKQVTQGDEEEKNVNIAADALVDAAAGLLPEGMASSTPSKEVIRTVFWPTAGKRFDQITIEEDFEFDDATQTISAICGKGLRHFPNTHFMRRLAGHLRLGLGRNATKEAILEKICQVHYGSEFTRPIPEGESSGTKRRSSEAGLSGPAKKRPVVLGKNKAAALEANLKARAAALTAWSSSLDTIATTIRQSEDRLQNMCQAVDVNFYGALMDRSKLPNDYLKAAFEEYDNFLALQKQLIANINEMGGDMKNEIPALPAGIAAIKPSAESSPSVESKTIGVPAILKAAETAAEEEAAATGEEVMNKTEV